MALVRGLLVRAKKGDAGRTKQKGGKGKAADAGAKRAAAAARRKKAGKRPGGGQAGGEATALTSRWSVHVAPPPPRPGVAPLWRTVGSFACPPGPGARESAGIAAGVVLQRKAELMATVERLYPDVAASQQLECVVQGAAERTAMPVDLAVVPPPEAPLIPAELDWLAEGRVVQATETSARVAEEELALLGPNAELAPLSPPDGDAAAALASDGCVRLESVLSPDAARAALAAVPAALADALAAVDAGEEAGTDRLGDVLCTSNRYDLLLDPDEDGPLPAAMRSALAGPLGDLLEDALGPDAIMHEFSVLIADPGAPRQPLHPDTPFQEHAPLVTCFMALQDVTADMGPTIFVPGTHTEAAHGEFYGDNASKEALLGGVTVRASTLSAGDVSVFDSRCLHAGSENVSDTRRAMCYFTFANPRADLSGVTPGSIRPHARGKFTLKDLRQHL